MIPAIPAAIALLLLHESEKQEQGTPTAEQTAQRQHDERLTNAKQPSLSKEHHDHHHH